MTIRIYDISPLLSATTAVWPGDLPLSRTESLKIKAGDSIDLSSVQTTVHIGAHADAPSHYHAEGQSIDAVALDPYWGECYVAQVETQESLTAEDVQVAIASGSKRLLFKTTAQQNYEVFHREFAYFSTAAIDAMAEAGVCLIGIDTPSFDHFDSKDLPAHQCLYKHQVRNLENLDLSKISEGHYELSALPLKLSGFDASPVRAALKAAGGSQQRR